MHRFRPYHVWGTYRPHFQPYHRSRPSWWSRCARWYNPDF